ncbi:MAG: transglycosylase SLT domain-containing protein [Candidatus Zixiibacteriota bacterium]
MSVGPIGSVPVMLPQTDIDNLKGPPAKTAEQEKQKLRKVTREFESLFMYQLMKTMRETVKESPMDEGSPFAKGSGKEIFRDLFDMELSRSVVQGNHGSLSDMLYKSMEKLIDAQYGTETNSVGIKPLGGPATQPPIPIHREATPLPPQKRAPTGLDSVRHRPMPLNRRAHLPADGRITAKFGKIVEQEAERNGIDSALIYSVIKAESSGNPRAESAAGAKGLMQLAYSTAADYGVSDAFDPGQNIRAGSRYLRDLIGRFGNIRLALAAYNAGPGNVEKYGGIPPFSETVAYVERVMDSYSAQTSHNATQLLKRRLQQTDKATTR